MGRAVAITGLGAVTAVGPNVPALATAVVDGRCGIRPLELFTAQGRCSIAASADAAVVDAETALDAPSRRRLSRADRFALAASAEACAAAGLDAAEREATAVFVGATTAGMRETEEFYRRRRAGETARFRPSHLLGASLAAPGAVVAQALGLFGARSTMSTACSSSALAIGAAVDAIRQGRTRTALALGCDQLCRLTYAGFDALQALDPAACRPFDRERHGLSLGEGAGALLLEDAEHARARGATIHAVVLGWGTTTDAHHVTAPHPQGAGAVRALTAALADAARPATAVDYVNAHGSATKQNDEIEVGALRAVLGASLGRIPVSSSKSQVGHTLAAAGAIEAVVTVLALRDGRLPATVGLATPEWDDVDFVPTPGRHASIGIAASSSYGFGGHNVTLVLARPEAA